MSLPFFYEATASALDPHFQLSEETSKHCIQVLRMKKGAALQLTNGKGFSYMARILSEDKKKAVAFIEGETYLPPASKKIGIALSPLKTTNRFEWFLEKATELGVAEIIPILCTRTEQFRFRLERMQQILIAAMLQSQQVWLPVLREPIPVKDVIHQTGYIQNLMAHCDPGKKKGIADYPAAADAQILIGPEGDFTPQEITWAMDRNFLPVTLGHTRLRSETAGIVAATLLLNR